MKYRVTYKARDEGNRPSVDVEADNWSIDSDFVYLYTVNGSMEVRVFGIPKTEVKRIQEIKPD